MTDSNESATQFDDIADWTARREACSSADDDGEGEGPGPSSERRTPRHNEWTRAKMVAFLRDLAASQSVHHAALSVGMSRQSAYNLRNRMQGTPFALGWEVALETGLQQLAHAAMDRALNGVEEPLFYHGELIGTRRRYDNRLAAWLLDNPWKVGRSQVAREYVAEGWDALLERVEWASLDWEAGEQLPAGRLTKLLRDPPDETPLEDGGEARRDARIAGRDQDRFVDQRSWYAAQAKEQPQRGDGKKFG